MKRLHVALLAVAVSACAMQPQVRLPPQRFESNVPFASSAGLELSADRERPRTVSTTNRAGSWDRLLREQTPTRVEEHRVDDQIGEDADQNQIGDAVLPGRVPDAVQHPASSIALDTRVAE